MPVPSLPSNAPRLRLIAMVLIAVPAAVLLLFGVGEMVGGDLGGIQHIPEAALLLLLAAAAWWRPRAVGILLMAGSIALLAIWVGWVGFGVNDEGDGPSLLVWAVGTALFFAPPFLAGWLLYHSAHDLIGRTGRHAA